MSKMLGANRFQCLKIDDDEDNQATARGNATDKNQSNVVAKKKSQKKKKKEDNDLRSMAFGTGRAAAGGKQGKAGGQQRPNSGRQATAEDWEMWQQRDSKYTDKQYEEDIENALLLSKMDAEQKTQSKKKDEAELKALGITPTAPSKNGKKKKKKEKQSMSLDEFNQLPPERVPGSDEEEEQAPVSPSVQTRVPVDCQDPHYFQSVSSDASRLLQKERIQEQYQREYSHHNALHSKYQTQLEEKDKEIAELREKLAEQEVELKQVKKRSAVVCKLLSQGEMKDKADVLRQVEQLSEVRDSLTEEVAHLTAELEKERTMVHSLKTENEKLKGKHGK